MKIHPVGAKLFHADCQTDGQTDMMMPIADFHNSENVPTQVWNSRILQLHIVCILASSPRNWPLYSQGELHYLMHWGLGGLDMVLAKMFLSLLEVKLKPTISHFTMTALSWFIQCTSKCLWVEYFLLYHTHNTLCILYFPTYSDSTFLPLSYVIYSIICHLLTKCLYFISCE